MYWPLRCSTLPGERQRKSSIFKHQIQENMSENWSLVVENLHFQTWWLWWIVDIDYKYREKLDVQIFCLSFYLRMFCLMWTIMSKLYMYTVNCVVCECELIIVSSFELRTFCEFCFGKVYYQCTNTNDTLCSGFTWTYFSCAFILSPKKTIDCWKNGFDSSRFSH